MVLTWKELKVAIAELTDEQLDMGVFVTSGCDENGNAEFFGVDYLTLNTNPDIAAAGDIFNSEVQPIIVFNE